MYRRSKMILTTEEREMLSGKCGEAVQWAMDFLVKLGDYFGAAELVDVKYVNILEIMGTSERTYLELIDYLVKG
jgi:predicted aconitase